MVVSALALGPDTQCLAKFTQLSVDFVEAIRRRMVAAELWTQDVHCDHWFAGANQVSTSALCADLLVAEGAAVRTGWPNTRRSLAITSSHTIIRMAF